MNREQKAAQVAELVEGLGEANAIFAIDYKGISVPAAAELRVRLADSDSSFRVVKNRLAKRAAAEAGTDGLDELFVGPVALTLIKGDPVVAAKVISTFSRENDVLEFKGGLMEGEPLDGERFRALASLPPVETMRGQLVGIAASPLTGLVRGLGGLLSGLAVALGQVAEQGLVGGDGAAASDDGGDQSAEESEAPGAEAAASSEADGGEGADAEGPEAGEAEAGEAEASKAEAGEAGESAAGETAGGDEEADEDGGDGEDETGEGGADEAGDGEADEARSE